MCGSSAGFERVEQPCASGEKQETWVRCPQRAQRRWQLHLGREGTAQGDAQSRTHARVRAAALAPRWLVAKVHACKMQQTNKQLVRGGGAGGGAGAGMQAGAT